MGNTRIALTDIQPIPVDDLYEEEEMVMEFSKKFTDAFAQFFFDE
ncbi:MAG: hypothetical protein NT038_07095 [Euryarchaeota archaeon]|nr:hypothetical protein [Euryarchaeota archaeon]